MNVEQVVVVGAGVAGCTAAIEAAKQGLRVMLIDEHPQTLVAVSLDAPYFYGSRLSQVLADSSAVADRVLGSNDLLLDCLDVGVNVVTGTCVWGSYRQGPNNIHASEPVLGVADADRSWLVRYEGLILAPGARDLVLSFPGWHLPGVLGAAGANALLARYQALSGGRMVVLGSGNTGLMLAKRALEAGIEIAAIVEVAPEIRGDEGLAAELESSGVRFLVSHVIQEALGEQEVGAVRLRQVDATTFRPLGASGPEILCDTVCMAFGLVPNIELAAVSGCNLEFSAPFGGWVPTLDAEMRTNLPLMYVVGDGAGVTEQMLLNPELAAEQGRLAARAITEDLSRGGLPGAAATAHLRGSHGTERSVQLPAQEWLRALVATSGLDVVLCQCEEATRRDLLEVRPPKYLGVRPSETNAVSDSGRTSQDLHKRLTRVGMGHCQGRRCREHAALLLAGATGADLSAIVPGSYRAPVRPMPLSVIASEEEPDEVRRTWPTWFHPLHEGEVGG